MQIRVTDISSKLDVEIQGNEPWLDRVVKDLQEVNDAPQTSITGKILLQRDTAGFIYCTGHVKHTPTLACSRCGSPVAWPLEAEIRATWRPPFESHVPGEIALTTEDLDTYFIEKGCIDIEMMVNDALQCALPSQVQATTENPHECLADSTYPNDTKVYGEQDEPKRPSPFDVLKNLV